MRWAIRRRHVWSRSGNPPGGSQIDDIKALVADLNAGKVDWLVILNANPIYTAPADLDFAAAFDKAKIVAHLGSHLDETGRSRIGIFRRRTFLSRGRMRGLMTERFQLCSR